MASSTHTISQTMLPVALSGEAATVTEVLSAAVDTIDYRRVLVYVQARVTGAASFADVKIYESSASGSGFTAITGLDTTLAYTTMDGTAVATSGHYFSIASTGTGQTKGLAYFMADIDLAKRLRYIKVGVTGAGGSLAGSASANLFLYQPFNAPTATGAFTVHV